MTPLMPWMFAAGLVLIVIALSSSYLKRMPLSTSILFLLMGIGLGPAGVGLLELNLIDDASLLEMLTEVAVIVSLFAAGLHLRLPLKRDEWRIALMLATLAMILTVAMVAVVGVLAWELSWGAAIILGALLAPTDPVLASDVQLEDPTDDDRLRFVLTGEAGFNDGTAFPFIMLGLGMLGLHEIGAGAWRWWTVDLLWAVTAGLTIGAVTGLCVGKLVLFLRQRHKEAVGLDNFLAVGLIATSYAVALVAHAYGFLAVFAAGVALRYIERTAHGRAPDDEIRLAAGSHKESPLATDEATAPAYMAESVLNFNQHLERFAEVALVVVVGSMLHWELVSLRMALMVAVLLLVVRPLAVYLSLMGFPLPRLERGLMAWFGIRGIGSLYYLSYAIAHDLPVESADVLADITLATIATSIALHGASVTPLMKYYQQTLNRDRPK